MGRALAALALGLPAGLACHDFDDACTGPDGGAEVPAASARVCASSNSACAVTGCGFEANNSPAFLGGCGAHTLAGALCCCE